jgi:hypothetical protein
MPAGTAVHNTISLTRNIPKNNARRKRRVLRGENLSRISTKRARRTVSIEIGMYE